MAKFSESTPADILNQHLTDAIQNENVGLVDEILNHPNSSPDMVSSGYKFFKSKLSQIKDKLNTNQFYPLNHTDQEIINKTPELLSNPKMKAEDAEDFINTAPIELPSFRYKENAHRLASEVKGVRTSVLENFCEKQINDGSSSNSFKKFSNLSPEFYEKFASPENLNHSDLEKRRKIESLIKTYGSTNKHTPESLDRMLNNIIDNSTHSDVYYQHIIPDVAKNKNISKDFINKIYEKINSDFNSPNPNSIPYGLRWRAEAAAEDLLNSPNVDPTLLAKIAKDGISNIAQNAALSHPLLPEETRRSIINSGRITDFELNSLLTNPNLSTEELSKIHSLNKNKLSHKAIKHGNFSPEEQLDFWKKSPKTKDVAESFLSAKKLHPEILKDLVNHKNQDIAVKSLSHSSVNEDVLNTALKRKAEKVSSAASMHPLVAKKELTKKLLDGKINPTKILQNEKIKQHFDEMPEEEKSSVIKKINEKYSPPAVEEMINGSQPISSGRIESLIPDSSFEDFLNTKEWLVTSKDSSPEIKEKNKKDIFSIFKKLCIGDGSSMEELKLNNLQAASSYGKILNLINNNDDNDAKQLLLNHSGYIYGSVCSNLSRSKDLFENKNPDFIRNLWEKFKENCESNTEIMDNHGLIRKFNKIQINRAFPQNEHMPQDVFEDIVLNSDFMTNKNMNPGLNAAESNGTYGMSVLDSRAAKMPEEEKSKMFEKLINLDSSEKQIGLKTVLLSLNAPKHLWRKAWELANDESKSVVLTAVKSTTKAGKFSNLCDTKTKEEILHKKYGNLSLEKIKTPPFDSSKNDWHNENVNANSLREQILSSLDSKKDEDVNLFNSFIQNSFSNPLNTESESDIPLILDSADLIETNVANSSINELYKKNPAIAGVFDFHHIVSNSLSGVNQKGYAQELFNIIKQKIKKSNPQLPEDEVEGVFNHFVFNLLNANSLSLKTDLGNLTGGLYKKEANGNLDFLTELKSDNFKKEIIQKLASAQISRNYISQAKKTEILTKDGDIKNVIHNFQPGKDRVDFIRPILLNDPQKLQSILPEILEKIDPSSLNPAPSARSFGKNKALQPGDFEIYKKSFINLFDLALNHDLDAKEKNNSAAFSNKVLHLLSGESTTRGSLNSSDRKEIISELVKHIGGSYQDKEKANKALFNIYQKYKANPKKLISSSILKTITKNCILVNDLNTLADISDLPEAPAAAIGAVAKALSNIESLSADQAVKLAGTTKSEKINSQMAQNIISKIFETAAKDPDAQKSRDIKFHLMDGICSGLVKTSIKQTTKDNRNKIKILNSALLDMSKDQDENVQKRANFFLRKMVIDGSLPHDLLISNFLTLPSSPQDYEYDLNLNSLSNKSEEFVNFINSTKAIEAAQTGWKLKLFTKCLQNVKKQNKPIIVDRILRSEEPGLEKDALISTIDDNNIDPEDIKKLANSFLNKNKNLYPIINNTAHSGIKSNMYYILGVEAESIGNEIENLKSETDPFNKEAGLTGLSQRVKACARYISFHAPLEEEEISGLEEKYDNCRKAIENVNNFCNEIANSLNQKKNKESKKFELSSLDKINLDSLSECINHIATTEMPFNKNDCNNILNIFNQTVKTINQPEQTSFGRINEMLISWTKNAKGLKKEDYEDSFKKCPELPLFIRHNDVITNDILDSLNLDNLDNDLKELASNSRFDLTGLSLSGVLKDFIPKMDSFAIKKYENQFLQKVQDSFNQTEKKDHLIDEYAAYVQTALQFSPHIFNEQTLDNCLHLLKEANPMFSTEILKSAIKVGAGGDQVFDKFAKTLVDSAKNEIKNYNDKNLPAGPVNFDKYETLQCSQRINGHLEPLLDSEKISSKTEADLKEMIDNNFHLMQHVLVDLTKNKYLSESFGSFISNKFLTILKENEKFSNTRMASNMAQNLLENPKISEQDFINLGDIVGQYGLYDKVFNAGARFNPAFLNPRFGGKFFRRQELQNPEVYNVNIHKLIENIDSQPTGDYQKKKNRLSEAMLKVGPEGMSWAEAKKKFPDFEKNKEIKNVFMQKQNKPVLPEDFAVALQELEKERKQNQFKITYAKWSGIQRHSNKSSPNLVVQLNNSEQTEQELMKNPKVWALYQFIMKQANKIQGSTIGPHPTTPQLISWSRVDTTPGADGWIIEELQSDFAQQFRKRIRQMVQASPSMLKIEGHNIMPEELKDYIKQIEKVIEGYHNAALEAIKKNAINHGVKKLYMHGHQVRGHLSYGSTSQMYSKDYISPAIKRIYGEDPATQGFVRCDYTDYPNWDQNTHKETVKKFEESPCWVMDLTKT